jgi:hypothetical protein
MPVQGVQFQNKKLCVSVFLWRSSGSSRNGQPLEIRDAELTSVSVTGDIAMLYQTLPRINGL